MKSIIKKLTTSVGIGFICTCVIGIFIYWQQQSPEHELFLKRFIKNPTQIGAIAKSSEWLAEAITTCTQSIGKKNNKPGRTILEVGAGTGVFTQHIINKMGVFDTLDVVEYDTVFYNILKERFGHYQNVNIYCCSIAEFNPNKYYDFIVSGLPFNAFPAELVEKILNIYTKILKPYGTIAYFEYIALSTIKKVCLTIGALFSNEIQKKKNDFDQTLTLLQAFRKNFESIEEDSISLNLPPARAVTCYNLK